MRISLSTLLVCQQVIEIHIDYLMFHHLDYVSRISTHITFIYSNLRAWIKNAEGVSRRFNLIPNFLEQEEGEEREEEQLNT
jgi:hypothetical protein